MYTVFDIRFCMFVWISLGCSRQYWCGRRGLAPAAQGQLFLQQKVALLFCHVLNLHLGTFCATTVDFRKERCFGRLQGRGKYGANIGGENGAGLPCLVVISQESVVRCFVVVVRHDGPGVGHGKGAGLHGVEKDGWD